MSHPENGNVRGTPATEELPPHATRMSRVHPASQFNNRYQQVPVSDPLCHSWHIPGHREASLLTERSCASFGTVSPTQATIADTHNKQTNLLPSYSCLRLNRVNTRGVIPSAWRYPQKLSRLIITFIISRGDSLCGSLSVPVSEGRGALFQNRVGSFCCPSCTISRNFQGMPLPWGESRLLQSLKEEKKNNLCTWWKTLTTLHKGSRNNKRNIHNVHGGETNSIQLYAEQKIKCN